MSDDYVDFSEENLDAAKSRRLLGKVLLLFSYLGIWSVAIVVFWLFTSGSDGMGYSLIFLYFLMPVTTFVIAFLLGFFHYWGHFKWFGAPVFGLMYMLAEYFTFSMSNNLAFHKLNKPHFSLFVAGVIISLIAMGIGHMGYLLSKQKMVKT